jgi:integrase
MANYALIARINAGNGKFPFVNVRFSKNHRPIPIEGATYYLRPTGRGRRTPIRVGKDVVAAQVALFNMMRQAQPTPSLPTPLGKSVALNNTFRKTLEEAADEYLERSKQKSHKTYLGYRTAVHLFLRKTKKVYLNEITRDDMLDFLHELRTRPSPDTGYPIGESTVFNYFLKTVVFLNDCGIHRYVAREDWVQKKDWPVNVDKRNKNKKYATYKEQEIVSLLQVANAQEEALIRFLAGTGFRIGEAAVAEWTDIDWEERTISVRFKPKYGFKPKDYEERVVAVSDTLLSCLKKLNQAAQNNDLIFPSPSSTTVDKHLDRIILNVMDKANKAGCTVRKPRKPCHAFRVLYATRRHQHGVDIETLRQELGHSDIATTQIYLRSTNTTSDEHRHRINKADKFPLTPIRQPSLVA